MNYVKSVCVPGVLEVAVGADGSSASSPKMPTKAYWSTKMPRFDKVAPLRVKRTSLTVKTWTVEAVSPVAIFWKISRSKVCEPINFDGLKWSWKLPPPAAMLPDALPVLETSGIALLAAADV